MTPPYQNKNTIYWTFDLRPLHMWQHSPLKRNEDNSSFFN